MQIKCFAIDDEPLALKLVESYIKKTPFLELAGSFTNAIDALAAMKTQHIDLLFLDIQMPNLTGIQMASVIDTFKTKVVFITAFDQYALEGFKVDAIDYLLKPVSYDDFLKSAQKAQRLIDISTPASAPQAGSITVRADYKLQKISYNDILYFESVRDYVAIHCEDGEKIMTLATLKGIESTLPTSNFVRVHRSFIVNIAKVKTVDRNRIVFGKTYIPISDAYKEAAMESLGIAL